VTVGCILRICWSLLTKVWVTEVDSVLDGRHAVEEAMSEFRATSGSV
jgi:hypothetical protein